ncbi:MAG: Hsp70 family protein, partial [Treponemataceae bacterium]|nr:Hsp70 family protein [Treponemataceae bacterium]
MKTIGIKLADGTFYPILKEGEAQNHTLDVTTVKDNQTKVQIDLYRSETASMDDAEYVDTLEVTKLNPHPNGEPTLHLSLDLDENNGLTAKVLDDETGEKSETQVSLVNRTLAERENTEPDFTLAETAIGANELSALEAEEAKPEPTPFSTEDFSFDTFEDEPPAENADSPAAEADDFNLDDITLDLPPLDLDDAADETEDAATQTADEPATDSVPAEPNGDDDFSLDDIPLDLPDFDEPEATAEYTAADPTDDGTAELA